MSFALLKTAGHPIGVDFGVHTLKVVQIAPDETPVVHAAAAVQTPAELVDKPLERLKFQGDLLPKLLKEAGFKGKRAVCSVSASQTFVQHVQVQKAEGVPLERLASAEIQKITGKDTSGVIIRPLEVGEVTRGGAKRTEVICFGMPRDLVIGHMKALRNAKLEPVGVHSEHQAAVRSIERIHRRNDNDTKPVSFVVDLGFATTKVMVANGSDLVFAKTILIGQRNLAGPQTQAAQAGPPAPARAGAASAPAASGKGQAGAGQAGAAVAEAPASAGSSLGPVLEALVDEIVQSQRYYQALFPDRQIERVVFLGGGSGNTELCRQMARSLRLAAQVVDPLSGLQRVAGLKAMGVDLARPGPGWAVPVGLCLSPVDL